MANINRLGVGASIKVVHPYMAFLRRNKVSQRYPIATSSFLTVLTSVLIRYSPTVGLLYVWDRHISLVPSSQLLCKWIWLANVASYLQVWINVPQQFCHEASPLNPKQDLRQQISYIVLCPDVTRQGLAHRDGFTHGMIANGV